MEKTTWLPAGWPHPDRVQLTSGHHLRPIGATEVDLDVHSVLSSNPGSGRSRGVLGRPPAMLTLEQDREDWAYSRPRWSRGASLNYALFDTGETELPGGGIHVDQPLVRGTDAEISWWGRRLAGRWADRRFRRLRGSVGQP
jgi:hypothetical protein